MSKENAGEIVITLLLGIAAAIIIARLLFPYILFLTILSFVIFLFELLGQDSDELLIYISGGAFIIFFLLSLAAHWLGFTFGNSEVGQAILSFKEMWDALRGVKQNITETMINQTQNVSLQIIRSSNTSQNEQIERSLNNTYDAARILNKIN